MIDKSQLKVGTVIRFGTVDEILPLFKSAGIGSAEEVAVELASETAEIEHVPNDEWGCYFTVKNFMDKLDWWYPIESIKEIISQPSVDPVDWDEQDDDSLVIVDSNGDNPYLPKTYKERIDKIDNYSIDTTEFTIRPKGEPIFHELATVIKIDDEAAGCFIRVQQFGDTSVRNGEIAFDIEEWQVIKDTIDKAVAIAEKINREEK